MKFSILTILTGGTGNSLSLKADKMERRYAYLFGSELTSLIKKEPLGYLPLGCQEKHGEHLPYGLDFLKAEQVCLRLAEKTGGIVFESHPYAGTHGGFGVNREAGKIGNIYLDEGLLNSTIKCLLWQFENCGFRKIIIYTGHYPNIQEDVLQRAVEEYEMTAERSLRAVAVSERMVCGKGDHAGIDETSLMLALAPELVKLDRINPVQHINTIRGYIVDATGRNPAKDASVEIGEKIIAKMLKAVNRWIDLVDTGKLLPGDPSPWGNVRNYSDQYNPKK